MKNALLTSLLTLLLFSVPARAEWNSDKDVNTVQGVEAKRLMDFVENMPWVADGEDTGKYIYVFADAGCSATKQFYTLTRKYTKDVQIRWIFVDGQGEGTYNSLYEERTPEALKDAFMSQTLPADKDPKKAAKIDQYVIKGFFMLLINKTLAVSTDRFAFPTFVIGTPEKAVLEAGLDPAGLGKIMGRVPTVPVKSGFVPEALTADQDAIRLLPLPDGYKYMNTNADDAPMHMMPSTSSPFLGGIIPKADWPVPCTGVTEDGFIAMQIAPNGGCIYAYDPVEVKRVLEKK